MTLATEWHVWGWWHGVTKLLSQSLDVSKNASDKVRISKQEDCLNSHSRTQQLQLFSPNIFSLFYVERAERARANRWALLMRGCNWIYTDYLSYTNGSFWKLSYCPVYRRANGEVVRDSLTMLQALTKEPGLACVWSIPSIAIQNKKISWVPPVCK